MLWFMPLLQRPIAIGNLLQALAGQLVTALSVPAVVGLTTKSHHAITAPLFVSGVFSSYSWRPPTLLHWVPGTGPQVCNHVHKLGPVRIAGLSGEPLMKVLIGGALVRGSDEDFPRPSSCYSYQCPCTVYIAIHKDGDLDGQVQGQTFLCHSQLVVIRHFCLKDIILMLEAVPRHVLWVQLRLRCGQQRSHVPETVGADGLAGRCALHKVCSQETFIVLTTFPVQAGHQQLCQFPG